MQSKGKTTVVERIFKEELALSLSCWIFSSSLSQWDTRIFYGVEVAPSEKVGPDPRREAFFRFVVNEDGFDAGKQADGLDLCCFSMPRDAIPGEEFSEFERMTVLTGELVNGLLLSLPEYLDMPGPLAYQIRDEINGFNALAGDGVFHGWGTSAELWRNEIYPRTTIQLMNTAAIH